MRKIHAPLFATLCLFAAPVLADQITHPKSGLQFDVPRGWTQKPDGNTLIALSPDESTTLVFAVTDISKSDEVVDRVTDEMDKFIQNPEITQRPTSSKVNDLRQVQVKGLGNCSGGEICNWDLTLVTGGKRNLLVVALGNIDKYQADINGVYRSIQVKDARSL